MSYIAANNTYVYNIYEQTIINVLSTDKENFLNNSSIKGIFGVDVDFGKLYCRQIVEEFPEYKEAICNGFYKTHIDNFIKLGNQEQFYADELNTMITANAARYIYHAILIYKYMKNKFNMAELDVVEIGGGYGGLCYWLRVLCSSIIDYTIIDLPAPGKLQEYCLNKLGTAFTSVNNVEKYTKSSRPLFVISNYGYSEFNEYYQTLYKNKIINMAVGGFMVWNNWSGVINFTNLPMTIEGERPEFKDCPNKFIYF
jgi:hypothetical protein